MGLELYNINIPLFIKQLFISQFFIIHKLKLNLVIKWVYDINLHVFMFFIPFILLLGSKCSLFNLSLMCLHFQDSRERFRRWRNRIGEG
jgi:hypothetical protein